MKSIEQSWKKNHLYSYHSRYGVVVVFACLGTRLKTSKNCCSLGAKLCTKPLTSCTIVNCIPTIYVQLFISTNLFSFSSFYIFKKSIVEKSTVNVLYGWTGEMSQRRLWSWKYTLFNFLHQEVLLLLQNYHSKFAHIIFWYTILFTYYIEGNRLALRHSTRRLSRPSK